MNNKRLIKAKSKGWRFWGTATELRNFEQNLSAAVVGCDSEFNKFSTEAEYKKLERSLVFETEETSELKL